jgi:hypothetical protein
VAWRGCLLGPTSSNLVYARVGVRWRSFLTAFDGEAVRASPEVVTGAGGSTEEARVHIRAILCWRQEGLAECGRARRRQYPLGALGFPLAVDVGGTNNMLYWHLQSMYVVIPVMLRGLHEAIDWNL